MNPLDQFESDQKILNEIKDLFEFAPPSKIRRSLEDLFFTHLTSNEPSLPNQQEITKHLYYLIHFLNEAETQKRFS